MVGSMNGEPDIVKELRGAEKQEEMKELKEEIKKLKGKMQEG